MDDYRGRRSIGVGRSAIGIDREAGGGGKGVGRGYDGWFRHGVFFVLDWKMKRRE